MEHIVQQQHNRQANWLRQWRGDGHRARLILLCLTFTLIVAVGSLCRLARGQVIGNTNPGPSTKILPGSVLTITVTDEADLSGEFKVSSIGAIHFVISDDVGKNKEEWDVPVAGKTAAEAGEAVTVSLKKFLLAPDVHLIITKMPGLRIVVTGPVQNAELLLPPGSHLSDALNAAGCESDTDYEKIVLLRKERTSGKTAALIVNFAAGASGQGDSDPAMQAGDRIVLQRRPAPRTAARLRTVRVTGLVVTEGDVPVAPKETIHELLAQVGGLKEGADRKNVLLHRGTTGKDYQLDADKIDADDPLFNIVVEPGDFIIVGRLDLTQRYGVAGEVRTPNVYPFDSAEHMTVLRAIEKAGGVTKKGDPHRGVLQRGYLINPLKSQNLVFDIDLIRKGKAQDWDLIPGDLIMIPPVQHRPTIWQSLIPLALHFLPFGL